MKRAKISYTYAELAQVLGFKWDPEIDITAVVDDPELRRVYFLVDGLGEEHIDGSERLFIPGLQK